MAHASAHDWLAHERKHHACDCKHDERAPKRTWMDVLLLAGGGIYFLQLIRTGTLANYVNVRFAWIAWLGMIAFFLLALAKLIPSTHEHDHGCSGKRSAWKWWLLALPVVLGLVLPSKPLNASVIRSEPDVQAMLKEQVGMQYLFYPETIPSRTDLYSLYNDFMPDKPNSYDDPLTFSLLDWFRIFYDLPPEKKNLLEGMQFDVTGFVYHGSDATADRFVLGRFFMRHCMFDTIPIGMPTVWSNGDALQEDSWVRVQGTVQYLPDASGKEVLTLVADSVKLTEQPETPYLYPDAWVQ